MRKWQHVEVQWQRVNPLPLHLYMLLEVEPLIVEHGFYFCPSSQPEPDRAGIWLKCQLKREKWAAGLLLLHKRDSTSVMVI